MRARRAVIIGGGLGGLASGLRLQRAGWHVTLLEAGPSFGGKMNRWSSQGFIFDTGPSLITMPWVFEETFAAAGSVLREHVELMRLETLADYRFDDGAAFTHSTSLPHWLATMRRVAPHDWDGFLRFQRLGARLFELSQRTFLARTPYEPPARGDLGLLRDFPLRHAWGNYHAAVTHHFRSPYLVQLFDRYPTYVGSSPYQSPATLALIPFLETAFGGFAVRGGLYRIVEGLVALSRANGVELCAHSPAAAIEHHAGHVTGVRLTSGERLPADVVVMNGDAAGIAALLGTAPAPARSRSMSGFVMLLGIGRELPQLAQHSVYFSADYRHEFSQIFDARRFPDDPTVYVNAPSRGDRSVAPPGCETLFVMANAPAAGVWDAPHIDAARRAVFARLHKSGFPDIERDLRVCDIWTPQRLAERYRMPDGAIYGADSHGWRNAFLRPPNRHGGVRGLYLAGGTTHPGGGTPTVLLSAKITCQLIDRDHQP